MKLQIKILISLLSLLLIFCFVFISLMHISYFNLSKIEIHANIKNSDIPEDIRTELQKLLGTNLFKINLDKIEQSLLGFEGLSEIKIKRFFPNTLAVDLTCSDFLIKIKAGDEYYCADSEKLTPISEDKYNYYSDLNEVEIPDSYASFLFRWGYDESFNQLLELASQLDPKFLITEIKYDNNNNYGFGCMHLSFSSRNLELCVKEPVTYKRLEEALNLIADEGYYDLYSNALIRRSWET